MTEAPNDSLPGPAALARSLGYAFVAGATVALDPHAHPQLRRHERDGHPLARRARLHGRAHLPAGGGPPAQVGDAGRAGAGDGPRDVRRRVLQRSRPERLGDLLRRRRPTGRLLPQPLVGRRAGGARRPPPTGWSSGATGCPFESWLGTIATVALGTWMVGTMRVRAAPADRAPRRRRPHRRAHRPAQPARPPGDRRAGARARPPRRPPVQHRRGRHRPLQGLQRAARPQRLRPGAQADRGRAPARASAASTSPPASAARSSRWWLPTPTSTAPTCSPTGCAARCARRSPSTGLTISLGIASYPKHGGTAEELMTGADRAVFAAKALGRDRTVIYNREIAANLLGEQTREAVANEGHLAAVLVLAETLDMRDAGTARHSQLVGRYARSIAAEMGMEPDDDRAHAPGRRAARHRQDRDPGLDPQEARRARGARVGRDAQAPRARRADPRGRPPRRHRRLGPRPPRAPRRPRLPVRRHRRRRSRSRHASSPWSTPTRR